MDVCLTFWAMSKSLYAVAAAVLLPGYLFPANAATIIANQNAFVYSQTPNSTPSTANQLEVAARGTVYNRKTYLGFDLTSLPELEGGERFDGSSLNLTLKGTPLIGSAPSSSTYTLSLELYAIVDGSGAFSASGITWNNAPKNNTSSNGGFITSGVVSLGIANITINNAAGTTLQNATVTWSGTAIDNLLNWSAGSLGDFYGTGKSNANQITLMIGSNGTESYVGLNFYSLAAAGGNDSYKPALNYHVVPEPGSVVLLLAGAVVGVGLRGRRTRA